MSFFNAPITTVQFYVPKPALEALDRSAVAARARAAGLPQTSYEYSTKSTPPTKARITCDVGVAICIIEELKAVVGRSKGPLVVDCAEAIKAALDAIAPREQNDSRRT